MNAYGIDQPCYPSVGEIIQARKIFTEYIQQHAHETKEDPGSINYTSSEIVLNVLLRVPGKLDGSTR